MSKVVVVMGVDGARRRDDEVSREECRDILTGQGHDVVVKSGRRVVAMLCREASKLDLVVVDFDNAGIIDELLTFPAFKGGIVAVTSIKKRRDEMERAGATVATMGMFNETVLAELTKKRPPQHRKILACFGNRNSGRKALFAALAKLRSADLARLHRSEELVAAIRQNPRHVSLIVVDFITFSYMRDRIARAGYQGKVVGVAVEADQLKSMTAAGLVVTDPESLLETVNSILRSAR